MGALVRSSEPYQRPYCQRRLWYCRLELNKWRRLRREAQQAGRLRTKEWNLETTAPNRGRKGVELCAVACMAATTALETVPVRSQRYTSMHFHGSFTRRNDGSAGSAPSDKRSKQENKTLAPNLFFFMPSLKFANRGHGFCILLAPKEAFGSPCRVKRGYAVPTSSATRLAR